MCGWVSADPKAWGCGVMAKPPSCVARRLSFSMPRRIPFSRCGGRAARRACKLLMGFGDMSRRDGADGSTASNFVHWDRSNGIVADAIAGRDDGTRPPYLV